MKFKEKVKKEAKDRMRGNYDPGDLLEYSMLQTVARNDGLSLDDFLDWFKYPAPFRGQIICWYENVKY